MLPLIIAGVVAISAVALVKTTGDTVEQAGDAIQKTGDASLKFAVFTVIGAASYLAIKTWDK